MSRTPSERLREAIVERLAADPVTNVKATVNLPRGDCSARVEVIRRVAELCPVHQTISTMEGLEVEVLGEGQ